METLSVIKGHVIQQIQTSNIDAIGRLSDLIIDVLEKGSAGREIPHFISGIPISSATKDIRDILVSTRAAIGRPWMAIRGGGTEEGSRVKVEWCGRNVEVYDMLASVKLIN